MMKMTIRFRQIVLSAYCMIGALCFYFALVAVFRPDGDEGAIFSLGLGIAAFVGAAMASVLGGGTSVKEGVIAVASIVLFLVVFSNWYPSSLDYKSSDDAVGFSLTTAFFGMVAAMAGSQFSARRNWSRYREHRWFRFAIAMLVIVGSAIGHGILIGILFDQTQWLPLLMGVSTVLVLGTPGIVWTVLQRCSQSPATGSIAGGLLILSGIGCVSALPFGGWGEALFVLVACLIAAAFYLCLSIIGTAIAPKQGEKHPNESSLPKAILIP